MWFNSSWVRWRPTPLFSTMLQFRERAKALGYFMSWTEPSQANLSQRKHILSLRALVQVHARKIQNTGQASVSTLTSNPRGRWCHHRGTHRPTFHSFAHHSLSVTTRLNTQKSTKKCISHKHVSSSSYAYWHIAHIKLPCSAFFHIIIFISKI